ncbi:hypothetical protein LCGC14_0181960 [marine sediment metagenome]|uniref:DUF1553 domain-containing protein n=1 Tax=marine sediment metagenome TaxID=412755 RepID=A0A0F9V5Z0_9ZZZZ
MLIIAAIGASVAMMTAVAAEGPEARGADRQRPAAETDGNRIDELVFGKLKELGIEPSALCSDAVFLRRVYLDVIGTLPAPRDVRGFLADKSPDKRSALIDELLERDEFADYWAMKWCDILRVKSELPSNLWPNAVQAYHRWIRTAIRDNMPYDRFARELLTSSGSNFRVPQVNFYRAVGQKKPQEIADVVALTFMGARTKSWNAGRRAGMAGLFAKVGYKTTAEWKEEIVYFDPAGELLNPTTGKPQAPVLPDGTEAALSAADDPRVAFADWLVAPENPWFARCIVNRIWFWLLGRGIIHEVDDIRPDNPPQNPELLAWLEKELVGQAFDLKHIYRLILNSRTYQLSAEHTPENIDDEVNFSHYTVRRLGAEVLIDAICQITGTTESYTSRIPEPHTFIPANQRSIALADGSISSPFLETFGRPPRDTGYASERNNDSSPAQRLHLLNSTHIHQKIRTSRKLGQLIKRAGRRPQIVRALYITILSRRPTAAEEKVALAYLQSDGLNRREGAIDLAWALLNTKEFMFRH